LVDSRFPEYLQHSTKKGEYDGTGAVPELKSSVPNLMLRMKKVQ
jgi:hypothetical protein